MPKTPDYFAGKTIIITGAASGIGRATALLFASGTALAFHCPKDMKAIDEALAKQPKLSEAQMKEVKALRASGEESLTIAVMSLPRLHSLARRRPGRLTPGTR